ncbi:hybrid sensor histidine kinase/response regulator [Sediminimonas sp.]|uniref:hybrid sensor histidine kinase/response regulator n=1 Tax=Sediminimonas sp. TaxID=2823379 RepID=UPI0025F7FFE7|nr:hybrid sensor histidine kinase/response regulator [Sediminimonas sp.]
MSRTDTFGRSDTVAGPRNQDHEDAFREMFDMAPNGVIQVDFESGKIKHANAAMQDLSGFTLSDLQAMRFDDLLDARASEMSYGGMVPEIASAEAIGPFEMTFMDAKGAPLAVEVRGKAWPDSDGRQSLWCFVCDLRDHRQKEVEQGAEINEAKERLADIIEAAQLGTFEVDVHTRMNHINDRWAEMLGYERAELEPLDIDGFRDLLHPDDLTGFDDQVTSFAGGAEVFEREARIRHKDGHYVWVFSRGRVARRDRDGRPVRISGIHLDISEQKAREEALRAAMRRIEDTSAERDDAQQRFFDVTNVSNVWYWEQDSDLRFTYLSDNLKRCIHLKPEMVVGKTRAEVLGGDQAAGDAADWEELARKVAAREPFRDFTYMVPGDGEHPDIWLRTSGAPFYDRDGNFAGYRGIGDNVTELVEAMKRAQAANRSKSQFLANMSHEIRTPLNGVLGMAELLESHIEDPDKLRMIHTIRRSGESLLNIINDLLDMAKIEAGRLTLENAPFRIDEILRRLEDIHLLRAEEKGLSFEVMIGSGCDQPRMGDSHRVQQVLHNLLSNAIKFTEKGSVNLMVLARKDQPLKITVEDTGIGMTPEQIDQVFDDFVQADSSIARRFGGTGLGMSIMRQMVTLMDGKVDVSSTPGEGTIITVTLPLPIAANQDDKPDPMAGAQAPHRFEGHRILVADDNPTNRELMAAMLDSMGAESMLVNDGVEAVQAAHDGKFDLILMDISMPLKDGVTALAEIREAEKSCGQADRVPVVAVTAHAMAHQIAEYVIAGFDTHLCKPFTRADLARTLSVMQGPERSGARK